MSVSVERFEEILLKMKKLSPILVLGDIGLDKYTYGEVSRISPEAPVPVLEVQKEWKKLGLAANVADNLQALEIKTSLCGILGQDSQADIIMQLLEDHHIGSTGVLKVANRMTTFKERVTTSAQQICRIDYETKTPISSDTTVKILDKLHHMATVHSSLIIEDYAKGMLSEQLIQEAISTFKSANKIVGVDPSRQTPAIYYKGATFLKPNLIEAKILAEQLGYRDNGKDDVEKISALLLERLDLSMIIITMGAKGVAITDREKFKKTQIIPTYAREVFDVSGAGDTFVSVLMASLVAGADIYESSYVANLAAGVVVGKKGTAVTSQLELKKFYKLVTSNLT